MEWKSLTSRLASSVAIFSDGRGGAPLHNEETGCRQGLRGKPHAGRAYQAQRLIAAEIGGTGVPDHQDEDQRAQLTGIHDVDSQIRVTFIFREPVE